jgi:hypothetical protein
MAQEKSSSHSENCQRWVLVRFLSFFGDWVNCISCSNRQEGDICEWWIWKDIVLSISRQALLSYNFFGGGGAQKNNQNIVLKCRVISRVNVELKTGVSQISMLMSILMMDTDEITEMQICSSTLTRPIARDFSTFIHRESFKPYIIKILLEYQSL